jgi:RimJ/RimL family protein N-acetyltransferase
VDGAMSQTDPILTTDRLLLRLPTLEDLGEYAPIFADPEVMRYIGDGSLRTPDRVARSIERGRELFEERGLAIFLATDRQSGAILGDCFVVPVLRSGVDPTDLNARGPEIELGYRLKKDAWGQGYATEAARAVRAWALGPDGPRLKEVIGITYPENLASQKVLLNAGFERRGLTDAYYDMTSELFVARAGSGSR